MSDTALEGKRRTWQWLTAAGFVATICFGFITHLNAPAAATLRPGHPLPAVVVSTAEGTESSLDIEAAGYREILIISPSCDECTDHLIDMIIATEAGQVGSVRGIEGVLLLVIESDLMPRADFMPALQRAQELGAPIVRISAREAAKLGIFEIPGVVELTEDGWVGSVSYPYDLP